MEPVAGLGGADPDKPQPEPLVPGSAVSAVLVEGDLAMSGTCTVTYVDPKRLLACGHPITQYGPVAMPMTKAEVVATLASPLNAFKIINTTETVGSFTEDRATAIMGRFDVKARMIPVAIEVVPPDGGAAKTFHFEVVDNRELTPNAMLVSVYQSLQGTNVSASEMSYRVKGELSVAGQVPVQIAGLMAQSDSNPGAVNTALLVGERFNRVYENALDQPVVTGLKLKMEAIPERRTAIIETARLSKTEAQAGETIEVEATIRPYQAEARVVKVRVPLPPDLRAWSAAGGGERWRDGGPDDECSGYSSAAAVGGAGGYGGAVESDSCERCGVCDAAGSKRRRRCWTRVRWRRCRFRWRMCWGR